MSTFSNTNQFESDRRLANQPIRKTIQQNATAGIIVNSTPTEWHLGVVPQLSPFVPQVGDRVIYCRKGHQLYKDQMIEEHKFPAEDPHLQLLHNAADEQR